MPDETPGFDAETLNMSMRKYLKKLGVTSQQEIEAAIRAAAAKGGLQGGALSVKTTVVIEEIGLSHVVEGEIALSADAERRDG